MAKVELRGEIVEVKVCSIDYIPCLVHKNKRNQRDGNWHIARGCGSETIQRPWMPVCRSIAAIVYMGIRLVLMPRAVMATKSFGALTTGRDWCRAVVFR